MAAIGITAFIQRACNSQHIKKKVSNQTRSVATNVVTPNIEALKLPQKQEELSLPTSANPSDELCSFMNSDELKPQKFSDERWKKGTWDLNMFVKEGRMDWDSVIVAGTLFLCFYHLGDRTPSYGILRSPFLLTTFNLATGMSRRHDLSYHVSCDSLIPVATPSPYLLATAKRRRFLEINPEASTNEEPVVFRSSIIPWWAWIVHSHLPEAELLTGRAAMVGFFMAYIVDALTGLDLVGQTGNWICKAALLLSVAGIVIFRRKEDLDNIRKLADEATYYDKQWQASWQNADTSSVAKDKSS